MKTRFTIQKPNQTGSALMLAMIMTAIALAILAGVMTWGATSNRMTHRSIQYTRSVAAAEAATEKVESQIARDFLAKGETYVVNNLNSYQNMVPTSADSSYWNTWEFNDALGNLNRTYVQRIPGTSSIVLDAPFAGLKAHGSTYTVVSHARDTASIQDVTAGVLQKLQLAGIPVFQFSMFSSGNMEISCGQPFTNTGPVYCDGHLYIEPDNHMTFESAVTAHLDVLNQRDTADGDPRGTPAGLPAIYMDTNSPSFPAPALTLPIGTTNTPEAIRQIIEPPTDLAEDPNSAIGKLRYFNLCDMVLFVSDSGLSARNGYFNLHRFSSTPVTPVNDLSNELPSFISTSAIFWDGRESKWVQPIDINIGNLTAWCRTNHYMPNLSSLYVEDDRTLLAGNLGAVRVFNGTNLPPGGLTVATGRPLYVQGDYNELDLTKLGSADTSATYPASLVADAITILSDNWNDVNQQSAALHGATATTVNAALLTGVVETTLGQYSGGMENFPRFLESWGQNNIFTYNGSMVKMFPSLYATNFWNGINMSVTYYVPPARNWSYDANFDDPLKLPPITPSFFTVKRSQWTTVPPGANVPAP
jgi:Tfp pilus assembly protein PilX